jgi:hypothetical protein
VRETIAVLNNRAEVDTVGRAESRG